MKVAFSEGLTIDHAPAAQRLAGAATLIGVMLGVAVNDVAATVSGVFRTSGVFTLPKLTTDVVGQGVQLYWDDTNRRVTLSSAGNTACGKAWEAAGNGVTSVAVKINV